MQTMGPEVFAIGVFAALFAGISKGGFGSGAAFAGAAILAVAISPGAALGIMLPILMLIDLASLRAYWRQWSGRDAGLLVLGGLPGVALGVLLFQRTDADVLRLLIGGIAIAFVLWQLVMHAGLLRRAAGAIPVWGGALAGMVAGFTSFVSHAGGPPAAVYLLSRGLDKTRYQATTVLVFWALNIAKAVPYAMLGLFTRETLLFDLALAPFALLGAWIGVRAHRRVPERVFFAITYILLVVTGAKLIWDGLN